MTPRILPHGDGAFMLSVTDPPGPALSARLRAVGERLCAEAAVWDAVQSFQTLTVLHDPDADRTALEDTARAAWDAAARTAAGTGTLWEIPARFAPDCGIDRDETAHALGMAPSALIAALCAEAWPVLAVGFLAGLPFLGPLPDALKLPRRATPRTRVPAGSIAIANGFCGIYPRETPGGWHLLGRTDFALFDPAADPAARLSPGDRVRFVALDP